MREPKPLSGKRVGKRPGQDTVDIVQELAQLRHRLGTDLETNLKQLRSVLADSERIARDLEAVLQQTRLAPVRVPSFTPGTKRPRGSKHPPPENGQDPGGEGGLPSGAPQQ